MSFVLLDPLLASPSDLLSASRAYLVLFFTFKVLVGVIRVYISMGDRWGYILPRRRERRGREKKERMFWGGERVRATAPRNQDRIFPNVGHRNRQRISLSCFPDDARKTPRKSSGGQPAHQAAAAAGQEVRDPPGKTKTTKTQTKAPWSYEWTRRDHGKKAVA